MEDEEQIPPIVSNDNDEDVDVLAPSEPSAIQRNTRSWRNPKEIASSVRQIKHTEERKEETKNYLGGSNISLDDNSFMIPDYEMNSTYDNDDVSSIGTREYYNEFGGTSGFHPSNGQLHPQHQKQVIIDDFSITGPTEDPPELEDNISLDGLRNFQSYTTQPTAANGTNNNTSSSKHSTGTSTKQTSNKNNKSFTSTKSNKKRADKDDANKKKSCVPFCMRNPSPYVKCLLVIGVLLLLAAIVLIILNSLGGKNNDNDNTSAVGKTTASPTTASPTTSTDVDSVPTVSPEDQSPGTLQEFVVPIDVSYSNIVTINGELDDESITTIELVTADRIQNELLTTSIGDANDPLSDVTVDVSAYNQTMTADNGSSSRRRVRIQRSLQEEEETYIVFMKSTISFVSKTVIMDKNVVNSLVSNAFNTPEDIEEYEIELRSTTVETLADVGVTTVQVDESPTVTSAPSQEQLDQLVPTTLPTVSPTKSSSSGDFTTEQCFDALRLADTSEPDKSRLNIEEYATFVSILMSDVDVNGIDKKELNSDPFDKLDVILRYNFFKHSEENNEDSYIDITGSKEDDKPSKDEEDMLEKLCTDTYSAIEIVQSVVDVVDNSTATPTTSPPTTSLPTSGLTTSLPTTSLPSQLPSALNSSSPTIAATTPMPVTATPTVAPTLSASMTPTSIPTTKPTPSPTLSPTAKPSESLSEEPTIVASSLPTTTVFAQVGSDLHAISEYDSFGRAVALSSNGQILAVGADDRNGVNGVSSGSVRIFLLDSLTDTWNQLGNEIDGEGEGDDFGRSIALSEDGYVLAVGARYNSDNGDDAGSVRVYRYNPPSDQWIQLGQDLDGVSDSEFGFAVDLSSDGLIVAVGARRDSLEKDWEIGSVSLFQWDTLWGQWQRVGAPIFGEEGEDNFGHSVSLSADGMVIAAGGPFGWDSRGMVQVLRFDSDSEEWSQIGKEAIYGNDKDERFGSSVSLSADGTIFAASSLGDGKNDPGLVRVYKFDEKESDKWEQMGQDIIGDGENDEFGNQVALSEDGMYLVIGGPNSKNWDSEPGYARVFQFDNESNNWLQVGKDLVGDITEGYGDAFGWSVAISSDATFVAVGGPFNDEKFDDGGHARVYKNQIIAD